MQESSICINLVKVCGVKRYLPILKGSLENSIINYELKWYFYSGKKIWHLNDIFQVNVANNETNRHQMSTNIMNCEKHNIIYMNCF